MAIYATQSVIAHAKPGAYYIERATEDVKRKLLNELGKHIFNGETTAVRAKIEKEEVLGVWGEKELRISGRIEIFPVNVDPDKVRMTNLDQTFNLYPQDSFFKRGMDALKAFVKALEE